MLFFKQALSVCRLQYGVVQLILLVCVALLYDICYIFLQNAFHICDSLLLHRVLV